MDAKDFLHFGQRLKEERQRTNLSQLGMADSCRVNRNTLAAWEKGEQAPNAAVLALMDQLGLDVLYIVTGRRVVDSSTPLPTAEKDLLAAWRHADTKGRALLAAAADVLKPE